MAPPPKRNVMIGAKDVKKESISIKLFDPTPNTESVRSI
jgi:hypothetical protein